MSNFSVTILGTNSSIPTETRALSSQIVHIDKNMYMIDCGEGTQLQLSKFKIKRNKIKSIFISHFHGDHLYGLPGLLTSYTHFERKDKLQIFGPIGLKKYIETVFEISQVHLSYAIEIIECDTNVHSLVYEDEACKVYNFPLKHRIPTQGFVFIEKINSSKLDSDKIRLYSLTIDQIKQIKLGEFIEVDGKKMNHTFFFHLPEYPKKYIYASDTAPLHDYPDILNNPDLLYHESTYLHELESLAISRGHSTAVHAAMFANEINAKKLILGHYSSRYKDINVLKNEARLIKPSTYLAVEGQNYIVYDV
jgi:ribonuclease Z